MVFLIRENDNRRGTKDTWIRGTFKHVDRKLTDNASGIPFPQI